MKIFITILLICISHTVFAKTCTGRMINPITDICWECMFPITIGAIPVVIGTRADTINPPSPVCICPGKIAGLPQVGMTIGLWEGIRLIDVTKSPFSFENKLLFLSLIFAVLRWCEFGRY
jgi:conjugal transfer pilus assembly protein TraU